MASGTRSSADRQRPSEFNHLAPRRVDHLESAVEALDARLAVVEGLDHRKPSGVLRRTRPIDVGPATFVPRSGRTLVEHVEVTEPSTMARLSRVIDMRRSTVFGLDNSEPFPEVSGVPPPRGIRRAAASVDVEVAAVTFAHGAPRVLEVPAPVEPRLVQVGAVRQDVVTSRLSDRQLGDLVKWLIARAVGEPEDGDECGGLLTVG